LTLSTLAFAVLNRVLKVYCDVVEVLRYPAHLTAKVDPAMLPGAADLGIRVYVVVLSGALQPFQEVHNWFPNGPPAVDPFVAERGENVTFSPALTSA